MRKLFYFSPFLGWGGTDITRFGAAEVRVNAFSNMNFTCLVAKTVTERGDLLVTWKFKNQEDPLKTGGKYRIPELEPISSCRRAFKLVIINVTADDEGVYSCHQKCKNGGGTACESSAEFKLKVSSTPPTMGKNVLNDFQLLHMSDVVA